MARRVILCCVMLTLLAACSDNRGREWNNLDYSRIARQYQSLENDPVYRQPTVLGCVDDDLYNCR